MGANILIVLLGMMAAYAIQVLGFRLSKLVRGLFLIGIIVPSRSPWSRCSSTTRQ
jgi:raffinose/stachyose/melibiose transport system permease protein